MMLVAYLTLAVIVLGGIALVGCAHVDDAYCRVNGIIAPNATRSEMTVEMQLAMCLLRVWPSARSVRVEDGERWARYGHEDGDGIDYTLTTAEAQRIVFGTPTVAQGHA